HTIFSRDWSSDVCSSDLFVLLLGVISSSAIAQDNVPLTSGNGYTQDSNGNIPRSDFGLCWRSGDWTPADALPGCDGALKPPVPKIGRASCRERVCVTAVP